MFIRDDLSDGSVDGGDTDFDMSLSPNTDQQKSEMERFVVWYYIFLLWFLSSLLCLGGGSGGTGEL